MNLADADLRQQQAALLQRRISSEELVREHVLRIEQRADLGAFVHVDAQAALRAARAADERLAGL